MSRAALPRLLANAKDVSTRKILVAARAAGVDLALEAAPATQSAPELHRGDLVIRYTNAIMRFMGKVNEATDVYGSSFMESAQVDSWLDWAELEFGNEETPRLDKAIETLEKHLDNRTFLVGQRYTMADISVSCSLHHMGVTGTMPSIPRATKRWLGTCVNQDAFAAVAKELGMPAAGAAAAPAAAPKAVTAVAAAAPAAPAADEPILASYSSCVGGRTTVKRIFASLESGKPLFDQDLSVCGWVRTMRPQKKRAFVDINDGSCVHSLPVVIESNAPGFEALKENVGTGASLKLTGRLVKPPEGATQKVELQVNDGPGHAVVVFGTVDGKEYPLAKKEHSKEFLRQKAHLRPRSKFISCVARIRSALAFATHEFFRSKGFVYVHTPLITASDCEGAGEMFQVTTLMSGAESSGKLDMKKTEDNKKFDYTEDFFGKPAFLTVSGQLSVENYCCALSNVYTFGPTFRAENSNTSRHLAEFWMIEPELAFADIQDDMNCAEDYLKYCIQFVVTNNHEDLEFFQEAQEEGLLKRLANLLAEPFARVTYTEAIEILQGEVAAGKVKFETEVEWGMDLGSEHERYLTEKVKLKPTIVYNYPMGIKAFYMRLNDDQKTVAAMDVLAPGIGEVIGGSQREERLDVLDRRIEEMDLNVADYWWYRDLRRFGSVPHSGFGLGFERLIMLATGIENIRDVIPYPRYPGHAEF